MQGLLIMYRVLILYQIKPWKKIARKRIDAVLWTLRQMSTLHPQLPLSILVSSFQKCTHTLLVLELQLMHWWGGCDCAPVLILKKAD